MTFDFFYILFPCGTTCRSL